MRVLIESANPHSGHPTVISQLHCWHVRGAGKGLHRSMVDSRPSLALSNRNPRRVPGIRAPLGLVLLLAAFVPADGPAQTVSPSSPLLGKPAPDFTLRGLTGRNVRLSDYRGDVVLVSFWTSWCGGCKSQVEQMARLAATYQSAGLEVIGVSVDDDRSKAASFAAANGGSVLQGFDETKATAKAFQIADVPLLMLIDRGGVVRYVHGEFARRDEQDLVQQIRKLLDE